MADILKILQQVSSLAAEAAGDDAKEVARRAKSGSIGGDDARAIEKIRKRIEALEAELKKAKAELAKLAGKTGGK